MEKSSESIQPDRKSLPEQMTRELLVEYVSELMKVQRAIYRRESFHIDTFSRRFDLIKNLHKGVSLKSIADEIKEMDKAAERVNALSEKMPDKTASSSVWLEWEDEMYQELRKMFDIMYEGKAAEVSFREFRTAIDNMKAIYAKKTGAIPT